MGTAWAGKDNGIGRGSSKPLRLLPPQGSPFKSPREPVVRVFRRTVSRSKPTGTGPLLDGGGIVPFGTMAGFEA